MVPPEYRSWGAVPAAWFIDPMMWHLGRRDALHHRYVNVWIGVGDRLVVDREEALQCEEGAALIAIGQGVIARQALDRDRRLLDQRRERLVIAKCGARHGQRRVGQANVRKRGYLLGLNAKDLCRDPAAVA